MIRRSRTTVLLTVVASGAVAVLLGLTVALFTALNCTDGDGGVPYVARDSAQAGVCDATGDGAGLALLLICVALGLLAVVWRLGRAWVEQRRGAGAFVAVAVAAALLPAFPGVMFAPFSAECSQEQRDANERWEAGGNVGEEPFDCASY